MNLFKQRGRLGLVARRVNNVIPNFEQLGLPSSIEKLCDFSQGMVVMSGITGSGKSTTIAAMLDYINQRERIHILTIEDPIEYMFTDKKAVINQREVGIDVLDWATALKHAVREDPDVILVGEMRDKDTFEAGTECRGDRPPCFRHDSRFRGRQHGGPNPGSLPGGHAPGDSPKPGLQLKGDHFAKTASQHQARRSSRAHQ